MFVGCCCCCFYGVGECVHVFKVEIYFYPFFLRSNVSRIFYSISNKKEKKGKKEEKKIFLWRELRIFVQLLLTTLQVIHFFISSIGLEYVYLCMIGGVDGRRIQCYTSTITHTHTHMLQVTHFFYQQPSRVYNGLKSIFRHFNFKWKRGKFSRKIRRKGKNLLKITHEPIQINLRKNIFSLFRFSIFNCFTIQIPNTYTLFFPLLLVVNRNLNPTRKSSPFSLAFDYCVFLFLLSHIPRQPPHSHISKEEGNVFFFMSFQCHWNGKKNSRISPFFALMPLTSSYLGLNGKVLKGESHTNTFGANFVYNTQIELKNNVF